MTAAVKLAGACLILIAGYAWGSYRTHGARRHVLQLKELERFLYFVKGEIEYRGLQSQEILSEAKSGQPYTLLCLSGCASLCEVRAPEELPGPERKVFDECFGGLGQHTGQESCRQLEYCLARCAFFLQQAQENECKANKLYRQLGLCFGALAVLLVV